MIPPGRGRVPEAGLAQEMARGRQGRGAQPLGAQPLPAPLPAHAAVWQVGGFLCIANPFSCECCSAAWKENNPSGASPGVWSSTSTSSCPRQALVPFPGCLAWEINPKLPWQAAWWEQPQPFPFLCACLWHRQPQLSSPSRPGKWEEEEKAEGRRLPGLQQLAGSRTRALGRGSIPGSTDQNQGFWSTGTWIQDWRILDWGRGGSIPFWHLLLGKLLTCAGQGLC